MATRPDDPYSDSGTDATEEAELQRLMESDQVPEPDEQDGANTSEGGAPEPDPASGNEPIDQPADTPAAEQPAEGEADATPDADAQYQDFLAKHKGKTAEELARLAFQQSKRANREAFDSRQSQERLNSVLTKIQAARDARMKEIDQRREAFDQRVEQDPDAALREAHRAQLDREQREAEAEAERAAFEARSQQAIEIASQAIPNFHEEAPKIGEFARREMGFTAQEVAGIDDPRMIVTLQLARLAGNLIKGGVLTIDGRFQGLPQAQAPAATAPDTARAQTRSGFGKQPARGTQAAKSYVDQLADVANMSDEDFAKLSDAELEALLTQE